MVYGTPFLWLLCQLHQPVKFWATMSALSLTLQIFTVGGCWGESFCGLCLHQSDMFSKVEIFFILVILAYLSPTIMRHHTTFCLSCDDQWWICGGEQTFAEWSDKHGLMDFGAEKSSHISQWFHSTDWRDSWESKEDLQVDAFKKDLLAILSFCWSQSEWGSFEFDIDFT